jgi:hypothetical protein
MGSIQNWGGGYQGDQMSLWKNRPKCIQTHFLPKFMHNYYGGKMYPTDLGYLSNSKSKQWPNRRKFAQSGHNGV